MRRVIIFGSLFVALFASLYSPQYASAHVLKSDGTIGAIFHIEPDDSATSGDATTYSLDFKDTENKLDLVYCDCKMSIEQNDSVIDSSTLSVQGSLHSVNTYTFKSPGVYTLRVTGTPKSGEQFNSFDITYLVRVHAPRADVESQPFPLILWVGLGLMVTLLIIGAFKLL